MLGERFGTQVFSWTPVGYTTTLDNYAMRFVYSINGWRVKKAYWKAQRDLCERIAQGLVGFL